LAWAAVVVAAWLLAMTGIDRAWVQGMMANRDPAGIAIAQTFSRLGEMHLTPLLALAVMAGIARLASRPAWWVAAWAGILGMVTAGVAALLLKMLVGRPRPKLQVEDVIQGFSWHWDYHSFPSGHTSHWFGLVAALALIAPRWSVGLGLFAAAVVWSRFYLLQHYIGDILGGIALGVTIGLMFGLAARRIAREHSTSTAPTPLAAALEAAPGRSP
jgi:undecaprenyl-diphosphatase